MMTKKWFSKVTTFVIGWFISLFIWSMTRKYGIKSYLSVFDIEYSASNSFLYIALIAVICGILFGSIQLLSEESIANKQRSFRNILIKGLGLHVFIMILIYLIIYIQLNLAIEKLEILFIDFLTSPLILVNLGYSIVTNIFIVITIHLEKLLGKGNLLKLITGRFYHPQEEERVFMFIDLTSSTMIAEDLGHLQYSRFIQDCFLDLAVVEKYNAEVYQYVGDEAVLTWKMNKTVNTDACLLAFFAFSKRLQDRTSYYQKNYGHVPFFKAGVHGGIITVVEIGSIKHEIAYHGDTINIASRVQEQCKKQGVSLLISKTIFDRIKNPTVFELINTGNPLLKGKKNTTELYSVSLKNNTVLV
ncbi:adenylate/guanylate cyclase domain-containing protein [Aquimarina sp. TRL1]|uniref:adenylate/guanylate cyclase domain-containing protein n=1 Tax=Aquimarina sp. (strain TRL1) TaxID=2736252 RepID=UPI00158C9498|nr:adenylate/guanylate cyclase domain-containing protein [Aquimarina sp. TRL1]QKX03980.1 adenylate/guanylate cyclase domain-containing protein [Aquimarina sp. TRL1]